MVRQAACELRASPNRDAQLFYCSYAKCMTLQRIPDRVSIKYLWQYSRHALKALLEVGAEKLYETIMHMPTVDDSGEQTRDSPIPDRVGLSNVGSRRGTRLRFLKEAGNSICCWWTVKCPA